MKPTRVFMSVETVRYAKPLRPSLFGVPATETRPLRYRAVWTARRTGTVVYKSKVSTDQAEVVTLARKWLAKSNERPRMSQNLIAAMEWTGPRYVDTTEHPERFGYSLTCKQCGDDAHPGKACETRVCSVCGVEVGSRCSQHPSAPVNVYRGEVQS